MIPAASFDDPRDRVARWCSEDAYEGQHLEFKSELAIGSLPLNRELLKDLTSMGNGGGGSVVFGLKERRDEHRRAHVDGCSPLTEVGLTARMKDLVADSVRPTLAWNVVDVEVDGGYVVIADVEPSRLGPYMVEQLREFRYWTRIDDRTVAMSERAVHDAYAYAARWAAVEAERWSKHRLPLSPEWVERPWVSVSALSERDEFTPLDPARIDREMLRADWSDHGALGGVDQLSDSLTIWADGFVGVIADPNPRAGACAQLRIHRDGAVGIGAYVTTGDLLDPARMVNAYLRYIGVLWTRAGIRAGAIRVEFSGLGPRVANAPEVPFPTPDLAQGQPYAAVSVARDARTTELVDSEARHRIVRDFADRIANMFGRPRMTVGFELGPLYQNGVYTELVAYDGRLHWSGIAYSQDLMICTDGAVRRPENLLPFGWWNRGLFTDLDGNAVAAVEFCDAPGIPSDFLPGDIRRDHVQEDDFRGRAQLSPDHPPTPQASRRWIDESPRDFIERQPIL